MGRVYDLMRGVGISAALILILEVVLNIFHTPTYIFPKPSEVWLALSADPFAVGAAWSLTVAEGMAGLVVAIVISSALAALTIFLPGVVARTINNLGIAIQSTPLLAIAPLLTLWFGQSFSAKASAACIVCFFPLLTGWLGGIRAVSPDYIQLFDNLSATAWQRTRVLIVPAALPYFFAGLRVAVPLALLGAIVGEFVGASEGIGFRILAGSYYVRTAQMFGYVIIAAITGWSFSLVIVFVERRLLFWHGQNRSP